MTLYVGDGIRIWLSSVDRLCISVEKTSLYDDPYWPSKQFSVNLKEFILAIQKITTEE